MYFGMLNLRMPPISRLKYRQNLPYTTSVGNVQKKSHKIIQI